MNVTFDIPEENHEVVVAETPVVPTTPRPHRFSIQRGTVIHIEEDIETPVPTPVHQVHQRRHFGPEDEIMVMRGLMINTEDNGSMFGNDAPVTGFTHPPEQENARLADFGTLGSMSLLSQKTTIKSDTQDTASPRGSGKVETFRENKLAQFFERRLAKYESTKYERADVEHHHDLLTQQVEPPEVIRIPSDTFTFFAIGDFGEPTDQIVVTAEAMGRYPVKPEFVLGLGDNFYPSGVYGVEDEVFVTHWYDVFVRDYEQMKVPWFNALGNHDYRGDIMAQIHFQNHENNVGRIWRLPAMNYTFSVEFGAGVNNVDANNQNGNGSNASSDSRSNSNSRTSTDSALIDLALNMSQIQLALDETTPSNAEQQPSNHDHIHTSPRRRSGGAIRNNVIEFFELDTNGVQFSVRNTYPETEYLLKRFIVELDLKLSSSTAKWKIVFGHHPLYTKGKSHGELGRRLGKVQFIDKHGEEATGYGLEDILVKHGVAAYITGHEHKMQYHLERGVHHFVSGAAGHNNRFYGGIDERTHLSWVDHNATNGFLRVDVSVEQLVCTFVSNKNEELHKVVIEK